MNGAGAGRRRTRVARLYGAAALVVAGIAMLAGCTIEFDAPRFQVAAEDIYATGGVLIPYEVRSDGTYATTNWRLRRFDAAIDEWALVDSWRATVANGTSGILQFSLPDARYELFGSVETSRAGLTVSAATLQQTVEFIIDTEAPNSHVTFTDNQLGIREPSSTPSYDASLPLEVTVEYTGSNDPEREAPVQLHYRANSTFPATVADPVIESGDPIVLWGGGAPSYTGVLSVLAVDSAGNVGSYRFEIYRTP